MSADVGPFDSMEVGRMRIPNRIVMAPITPSRAYGPGLASRLMAHYYAQRAAAGLIITEGVQPASTVRVIRAPAFDGVEVHGANDMHESEPAATYSDLSSVCDRWASPTRTSSK
jgi:2,4-dienoyl-CoA reductase-like NADH-dependent reductase (Old Yellow Enzyme family)